MVPHHRRGVPTGILTESNPPPGEKATAFLASFPSAIYQPLLGVYRDPEPFPCCNSSPRSTAAVSTPVAAGAAAAPLAPARGSGARLSSSPLARESEDKRGDIKTTSVLQFSRCCFLDGCRTKPHGLCFLSRSSTAAKKALPTMTAAVAATIGDASKPKQSFHARPPAVAPPATLGPELWCFRFSGPGAAYWARCASGTAHLARLSLWVLLPSAAEKTLAKATVTVVANAADAASARVNNSRGCSCSWTPRRPGVVPASFTPTITNPSRGTTSTLQFHALCFPCCGSAAKDALTMTTASIDATNRKASSR
mmetsp:Transcript_83755/g.162876  ORF Transcript_83755/g.162876 Transcript_83755/m.162876 type:complete len:310 (-) Transcript_83755:1309-2238(-)